MAFDSLKQSFAPLGRTIRALFPVAGLLFTIGCGPQAAPPETGKAGPHVDAEHGAEGPHGGHLIELGDEKYHVELVHDDKAGEATFYVLDGTAKKPVPIDAVELLVNVKHDGKAEQFKVAAKPEAGEPAGSSSRFVSADKQLTADLDAAGVAAELVVTIGGKQYRGPIEHEHGQAEHAEHKH